MQFTPEGCQLTDIHTHQSIVPLWPWSTISKCKGEVVSDDPADMELFTCVVDKVGEFQFECEDSNALVQIFETGADPSAAAEALLQAEAQADMQDPCEIRALTIDEMKRFEKAWHVVREIAFDTPFSVHDTVPGSKLTNVLKILGANVEMRGELLKRLGKTEKDQASFTEFCEVCWIVNCGFWYCTNNSVFGV